MLKNVTKKYIKNLTIIIIIIIATAIIIIIKTMKFTQFIRVLI